MTHQRARGNQLPQAKLTPETVREIRANRQGLSDRAQAKKYGVSENSIYLARNCLTWGWV